ncbi:Protein of unknown function [Georgenia satyanarayanai]|uniref:DUF1353 domain-containing protein n=1 Tax=Georgenia satyanarayanai TaxID=860221 RepID=A0A2Y9AVJ4_9MICO|nr:DUF1353 domain-containing protein [Georgenia satyanarayanai]PYF95624.1 uncharacterized protein DUF1353 [Georgenia satyanarayanai]SSA47368.1 Protein of unknown function [Georgenia satyanarayanai]
MPFVRESGGRWRSCTTVDLRQLPERGRTRFEVLEEFGYTRLPPDGRDAAGPTWTRAAVEHVVPAGFVTDLASVPTVLWGVIASYGRQTLPAVLHDMLYAAARDARATRARRLRREADTLFRATLRATGAGPVRQWLMWAGVRTFGSPAVVVPLVVAGLVLLGVGVLALGGWLTAPSIALVAVVAALGALLVSLGVASVEQGADGRARFRPASLGGLLGASGLVLLASAPVVVVIVVTTVVRFVVELGERPVAQPGRPAEETAPTARITWSPLLARVPGRPEPPLE